MRNKILRRISILSLIAVIFSFGSLSASGASVNEALTGTSAVCNAFDGSGCCQTAARSQGPAKTNYKGLKLYVGGMPFGVKFLTEGVIISGFNDNAIGNEKNPAKAAGLQTNDIIISINGEPVLGAAELNERVEKNAQKTMTVKYSRAGAEATAKLTPVYSEAEGRYTLGIYVRDSGAGIGTITYIVPKTQEFAGLGHGICDGGTGRLIPIQRGSVVGVKINGIIKGLSGSPGEVKGYFNSGKTGTLLGNTDCGVWGVLAALPAGAEQRLMEVGLRDSVNEGKAYVYTQLDSDKVEKYEIEICDIQRDATGNKCFTVKITDKALIAKTGGIIQGMSGSPIVQNGKIIGAVTHVLINDPTTGYGIFIENMLNAAQTPNQKAA